MKRREFLGVMGGAAAAWPVAVRAQQPARMRRIGILLTIAESDPEAHNRIGPFQQGLQELGWIEGHNIKIDYRFTSGLADRLQAQATELVASAPDVILVNSTPATTALHQATRTIPIVFAQIIDPIAAGVVESLAKPGGNVTGFTSFEFAIAGKWLELLKEVAPNLAHVTVLLTPGVTYMGLLRVAEKTAKQLGVRLASSNVADAAQIELAIAASAREPNGGLIVLPTPLTTVHRDVIVTLAARHRLAAVYPFRYFVTDGGLISYGVYLPELYRRSASYVDRILKGENPANLPVQAPTKFELFINLKTAKALGLTVPPTLLALADEVIE